MEIITRDEAKRQNLKTFYTGTECKNGHDSPRYTSCGRCLACLSARASASYIKNREHRLERSLKYQQNNAEAISEYQKSYRENHRQELKLKRDTYRLQNADEIRERKRAAYDANAEHIKAKSRDWKKNNPQKVNAQCASRRAYKLERQPSWADAEAISQFYRDCPPGMQVDHIIPLKGKLVSGLHVLENLQYLTPSENASKSNSFVP